MSRRPREPWPLYAAGLRVGLLVAALLAVPTAAYFLVSAGDTAALEMERLTQEAEAVGAETAAVGDGAGAARAGLVAFLLVPVAGYAALIRGFVVRRNRPYIVMAVMQLAIIAMVAFGVV